MQRDGRKRPVHLPVRERFNTANIIFVSLCAKDRKRILARQEVHQLLRQTWILHTDWVVGRYVLMPDHLHLFCAQGYSPELR
jgi:putative transposase